MKPFSLVLVIALVLVFALVSVAEVTSTITSATPKPYKPTTNDEGNLSWKDEIEESRRSNTPSSFTEPIVIVNLVLAIITSFYVILTFCMLSIMKRDKEHSVIVEIVKDFLNPFINMLKEHSGHLKTINSDEFPIFLDFQFVIPPNYLKGASFARFANRKPLLKWKLLRYEKSCSKFNAEIEKLRNDFQNSEIGTSHLSRPNGTTKQETVIKDQYEDEDKTKILKEYGYDKKIEDVEKISKQLDLDKKAKNLTYKLEKIKTSYRNKYSLTDDELL